MVYMIIALFTMLAITIITIHHYTCCVPRTVVITAAPNNVPLLAEDVVEAEYFVVKSINVEV